MIKYALVCKDGHHWDAWFASMSGYDDQVARGLVECPLCGTKAVEKAPMAPAVVSSRSDQASPNTNAAALPVASEAPSLSVPEPLRAMMADIKAHIESTHDYVGDTFAREVRAMHDGETQERPVYGEATASEVKALIEDDIPVAPLPMLASPKGNKAIN